MTLEKKIELAEGIGSLIKTHLSDVWSGFAPCPFILYDKETQVGIGDVFPERLHKSVKVYGRRKDMNQFFSDALSWNIKA